MAHAGDRGPTVADRLNLKKYVTLRTVGDLSSSLHLTGEHSLVAEIPVIKDTSV